MDFDELTISLLVSGPTPNTDALQDAHLASLHESGSLLAAGPLSDPTGELRGLSILNVPVDEARRLKKRMRRCGRGCSRSVSCPGRSRPARARSRRRSFPARCETSRRTSSARDASCVTSCTCGGMRGEGRWFTLLTRENRPFDMRAEMFARERKRVPCL